MHVESVKCYFATLITMQI